MIGFVTRRLAWVVVTLLLVVSGSFALAYVVPADPARQMAGPHASAEVVERIRAEHHLDEPVIVQYRYYLGALARGDLGRSYRTDEPVTAALARAFPNTALLAVGASFFQVLVGIPIGLFAALRRRTVADVAAMALALVGISAPTFLTGLGLLYFFGFQMDLFPLGGRGEGVFGVLRSAVLPSVTLGMAGAAYYSRLMRGEYLDVAGRDFMRTARAKGLPERTVIFKHALRNALLPVVTLLGLSLPFLFSGSVLIEIIFAWPGMGRLIVAAIFSQDTPLIIACFFVFTLMVVAGNLLADMLYSVVDPRIRLG